jgi:hypothetical protein
MNWELANAGTSSLLHSSLPPLRVCRCFFPSLLLRWCFVVVVTVSLRTLSDRWISFSKASLRSLGSEGLFALFLFPFSFGVNQSCVLYIAVIIPVL